MKTPTPMGIPGEKCPVTGCIRGKETHHAMCGQHWEMVPRPLKNRLWEAAKGMKDSLYSLPRVERYKGVLNTCTEYVTALKDGSAQTSQ